MFLFVFLVFIFVIANEALVELISKAGVFSFFREFLGKRTSKIGKFFYTVVMCPYCFSVWASFLISFVFLTVSFYIFELSFPFLVAVLIYFVCVLFFHRASNVFHSIGDRLDKHNENKDEEI